MNNEALEIVVRIVGALLAGSIIGLERSYHGRPAGFRTHTLVCMASSLLMLVTVYESLWFAQAAGRAVIDPTRMAQGIMTGIGFLGAGVIMKEGLSVRGLTTAASIWITSAIGILVGIGFYFPAALAVAATIGTLSAFRWIETRMPSEFYAHFHVHFMRDNAMAEDELVRLVGQYGFSVANMDYGLTGGGKRVEYRMVLRTVAARNARALSDALQKVPSVIEFRISPAGG